MNNLENNVTETAVTDELIKKSLDLYPANSHFYASEGGLVSLSVSYNGTNVVYERISLVRAFPISDPDEYISVREPSSARSDGREIGMIKNIHVYDDETVAILKKELDRRYFTPEIIKINSVKDKFGYLYFDAVTSAGKISFTMTNPYSNLRKLVNGSVLITDIDGNCFRITSPEKLDRNSYKKIEVYL